MLQGQDGSADLGRYDESRTMSFDSKMASREVHNLFVCAKNVFTWLLCHLAMLLYFLLYAIFCNLICSEEIDCCKFRVLSIIQCILTKLTLWSIFSVYLLQLFYIFYVTFCYLYLMTNYPSKIRTLGYCARSTDVFI